jgi:uncharacterized protein (TIGR00369 family)
MDSEIDLEALQQTTRGLLPETLGIRFLSASRDCVEAELFVSEALCTTPGVMHGGAIMAFADTLGAYATVLNLPPRAGTTTIESKTNFFSKAPSQARVRGVCVPLHKGRRTLVWQTRISREDERLVALVTQTQIVLPPELSAEEQLAGLFATGETLDRQELLGRLERSGGALYRGWAEHESDPDTRAALLAAADREDQNAEVLEALVARRAKDSSK